MSELRRIMGGGHTPLFFTMHGASNVAPGDYQHSVNSELCSKIYFNDRPENLPASSLTWVVTL